MRYGLTDDLKTGNALIDSEHKQLFDMVNQLQDACSKGKGRAQMSSSAKFLLDYVKKHFQDEEKLQQKTNYPGYPAHHKFHELYKKQMAELTDELLSTNASIPSLAKLNQLAGTLISHIRVEDKKLAAHIRAAEAGQ